MKAGARHIQFSPEQFGAFSGSRPQGTPRDERIREFISKRDEFKNVIIVKGKRTWYDLLRMRSKDKDERADQSIA